MPYLKELELSLKGIAQFRDEASGVPSPKEFIFEFLTRPRSTADFLNLRRIFERYVYAQFENENDQFLRECLIPTLCNSYVLPYYRSRWRMNLKRTNLGNVEVPVFARPRGRCKVYPSSEEIICQNLGDVQQRTIYLKEFENKMWLEDVPRAVGLIGGKWRMGVHSEQRQTILNAVKVLAPLGGILAVSVESNESILARRSQKALPLQERLEAVASVPGVDIVFPVYPPLELPQQKPYYEELWQNLGLAFYFTGEHHHPLFQTFAERAKKLGITLLWDHEEATVSATKLIATIAD